MTLKTKFKISSVVVIGLALSIGFFIFMQTQEIKEELEENKVAGGIMKGSFELNILAADFLLNPSERNREQWQTRYQSIDKLFHLHSDTFGTQEEKDIFNTLHKNHEEIQTTFSQFSEKEGLVSQELEERLRTGLLVKSQTMVSNASRLMDISRAHLSDIQQRTMLLIMISIVVGTAIMLLALLALTRSILGPVLVLQKGAEIIGRGNLKHRIKMKSKDEIGQLARSFNEMGTKLRKSYYSLEQKIEELKELDKLKDDFLNTTTHELKTPLIPIHSQLQLLLAEDYGELNKEQKKSLEMVLRNEERLDKLVSDVLDISRIRSKKLKITPKKFSLAKIVRQVAEEMEPEANKKKIDLTTKLADLPEITADPGRISQVVGNLVNNAIKFTPEKGKITIEVEKKPTKGGSASGGKEVIVKVIDTGVGISPKNLKKLFTPFVQLDIGLARKHGGTGLGLVISKGIIEAHGGKIWAESKGEGKGSTFSFSLPIGRVKIK